MKRLFLLLFTGVLALEAHATAYTFKPSDGDLGDFDHQYAYTWGINSTSGGASYQALLGELSSTYVITGAVLTIKDLYNWDIRDTNNQLFMHVLDNPKKGVKTIKDDPTDNGINQGVLSDYFNGKVAGNLVNNKWVAYGYANTAAGALIATGATNSYLTQYHDADGPVSKVQFSYQFNTAELGSLSSYILNRHTGGNSYADFGLGFDPDCHFYNNGVQLVVTTGQRPTSVGEAGTTAVFIGIGLMLLLQLRRFAGGR